MTKKRIVFEQPEELARAATLRVLNEGTPSDIESALVGLSLNDSDLSFVLETLLRFCDSTDKGIRGTSILCIGHLARIHRQLPNTKAIDAVRLALSDSDAYVRGQAQNAADDIEIFIPELASRVRA